MRAWLALAWIALVPTTAHAQARLVGAQIVLDHTIHFATESTRLLDGDVELDAVAALLAAHPEIARLRVAYHVDGRGAPDRMHVLGEQRAEAIVRALIDRGVAADRLEAVVVDPCPPASHSACRDALPGRHVELRAVVPSVPNR